MTDPVPTPDATQRHLHEVLEAIAQDCQGSAYYLAIECRRRMWHLLDQLDAFWLSAEGIEMWSERYFTGGYADNETIKELISRSIGRLHQVGFMQFDSDSYETISGWHPRLSSLHKLCVGVLAD